jgi:hypothetical protein
VTKEQRADALLMAARHWQMGMPSCGNNRCACYYGDEDGMDAYDPTDAPRYPDGWQDEVLLPSSSAALSEVAGMGYDIVNADGSDCEKVSVVDWARSDDENRYILRKVLK